MKPNLKYRIIYKHKNQFSISAMCSFFEVSRSGYYSWCKGLDKPDKDAPIGELIRACQASARNTYGYRRVKVWLEKKAGLISNHKAVLRIMNKYGLLSQIRRQVYIF